MTKEEINKEIENILERNESGYSDCGYSIEMVHIEADKLMCKVLEDEGYNELVDWFKSLEKWYS